MTPGALIFDLTIRPASAADAGRLATFAAAAFNDTFGPDNRPEDMGAYLAESFGEALQRAEIEDPTVTVLLAEHDGELVGYAMLRDGPAPKAVGSASALEIARLYAGTRWIGGGIGARLMERCLADARARAREVVWLGVWERNARAIAFYRRWGFADVGAQSFQLGGDLQRDRLMARRSAQE